MKREYQIQIKWTAFPLHPEIPPEGITLEELFRGRPIDIPAAKARLKAVAEELGLPLGDRSHSYNSRLAQELAKWAEGQGMGDPFHAAVFRAYFVDGRNIGLPEVLVELASGLGLPADEASRVLKERTFARAVDEDWERSHALGITAVPTFLVDRMAVVGAQPYEALERLVVRAGAMKRGQSKRGQN